MKKIITAICIVTAVTGCRPLSLSTIDPQGPPEYQLGWEDGCDTGLSAEGGWEFKVLYGFKKRPEMSSSDQYKQGWNEGFTYCRFSLAASKSGGSFGDIYGGGDD